MTLHPQDEGRVSARCGGRCGGGGFHVAEAGHASRRHCNRTARRRHASAQSGPRGLAGGYQSRMLRRRFSV